MDLGTRLALDTHPRSARYDPRWLVDGAMGPHPLWLCEDLTARMALRPGMRVLDLGCGRARTSVFLAREFDVTVHAADLWIAPTENWEVVRAAGVGDRVVPVRAEAHDLPFAEGYFDAVVSVDAYQYFGTDDLYLAYLARFLRPGGLLGVAVPALAAEVDTVPAHLAPYWDPDFACFHSPRWWAAHWRRSGRVEGVAAEMQPDGWRLWRRWAEVCGAASGSEWLREASAREAAMLDADDGRTLGFALVTARTPETPAP